MHPIEKLRHRTLLSEDTDDLEALGIKRSDAEYDRALCSVRESAYRRGFQQGLAVAVRMMQAGATVEEVERYMDLDVARWRFGNGPRSKHAPHRGAAPMPPPWREPIVGIVTPRRRAV
jgi:hypothetical protein